MFALNCLWVQSRVVLENMLYVLSIDLFVDLNSLCRWRIWTFLTGYHSIKYWSTCFCFECSLTFWSVTFCMRNCVWNYMLRHVDMFTLKEKECTPFTAAFICLFYATLPFQLKIMYLYNFIDGNWNGRSCIWEEINLSRIVSDFFSIFFFFFNLACYQNQFFFIVL